MSTASRRAGDPPALYADPARLKAVLGLDPGNFAAIDKIAATAAQWDAAYQRRKV